MRRCSKLISRGFTVSTSCRVSVGSRGPIPPVLRPGAPPEGGRGFALVAVIRVGFLFGLGFRCAVDQANFTRLHG